MRESSANRNEGGKPARWEFGGTDNNNNIAVLSTCSFSRACPEDMKPWKDDDTLEILAILLFSPMSRFYFFSFILPRRQPECAPFWALYMRAQMEFSVYTQTTSAPYHHAYTNTPCVFISASTICVFLCLRVFGTCFLISHRKRWREARCVPIWIRTTRPQL